MEHLISLPGGRWSMWRCTVLRGTGFAAEKVLRMACPSAAAAADRVLELGASVEHARERVAAALDRALDELRERGDWEDKTRRKPLLNAFRALKRGVPAKGLDAHPGPSAEFTAWLAARDELEAAERQLEKAYELGLEQTSQEIEEILAKDGHFREAVTWQNRRAIQTIAGAFGRRRHGQKRNSQRRQHEEMLANYLQRYCVKNDTVGFFGPVGWAEWIDEGEAARLEPGPELLERREVYFEHWPIDTLAKVLAREDGPSQADELRPWWAPRLRSTAYLDGGSLHLPFKAPLELDDDETRLLAACDGQRTARSIADELTADPAVALYSESEVLDLLADFARRRIITWALEVPLELYPERALAEQLERIEDEALRQRLSSPLEELCAARDDVAAAAGDATALGTALEHLEETFQRVTGAQPSRHHGQTYAARGLVYEDCRRATELALGPEVRGRLGPPLSLVLDGARWVASELTRRAEAKMLEAYRRLAAGGSEKVDSYALLSQTLSALFFKRQRDPSFTEVEEEYRRRWARVLDLEAHAGRRQVRFTAEELAPRVAREFGNAGRTWDLTRYLSPDVMIAAEDEEALNRGEFELVLGELHSGSCTFWSCFVSQHPNPDALRRDVTRDMENIFGVGDRPFVLPQLPRHTQTQRMAISLLLPSFYRYRLGDEPPDHTPCRSLPAAEVVIFETDEGLQAATRDGRLSFAAINLLGSHLTPECSDVLGSLLAPADHSPRISIGDVVISRERWRFAVSDLGWAAEKEPRQRFSMTRDWARRHALPRFCFYKFAHEKKPCYLDLESPIYVDIFLKILRAAGNDSETFSVSEMLPRADQAWLRDAAGNRYTCELRTTTLECAPGAG